VRVRLSVRLCVGVIQASFFKASCFLRKQSFVFASETDRVCAPSASSQLVKAIVAVKLVSFCVGCFPHLLCTRVAIMDSSLKVVVYLGEAVLAIDACREGVSFMV